MKSAISVCGKIGSGKSTILRALSERYGWDIVSFGGYIKSLIADPNPPRETYQRLGQELFASRGPKGLLEDALEFCKPQSDTYLIDGIRHVSVVHELRAICSPTSVIFLSVSDDLRYQRFLTANSAADPMPYKDFLQMCKHPIEQGIDEIASLADLVVDASRDFGDIFALVNEDLRRGPHFSDM